MSLAGLSICLARRLASGLGCDYISTHHYTNPWLIQCLTVPASQIFHKSFKISHAKAVEDVVVMVVVETDYGFGDEDAG